MIKKSDLQTIQGDRTEESYPEVIEFVRKKDLRFVAELGQGACGKTLLLFDETIDQQFVCKKYSPINDSWRKDLFSNFVREIKILHLLHHPNVVRLFNYYLYPDRFAGYILMEYVAGHDIEQHLVNNPDQYDSVFSQVVSGFEHLERNGILHRDIRIQNVLVSNAGEVKIIDFGFGKHVAASVDFGKSITLNWWCPLPREFADNIYDFTTEVYFVGMLFKKIHARLGPIESRYFDLIGQMCDSEPSQRPQGFLKVAQLLTSEVADTPFSDDQLSIYRRFSAKLSSALSKIDRGAKYVSDPREIERRMTELYSAIMLETYAPNCSSIVDCFLDGEYFYPTTLKFETSLFRDFLSLFRSSSVDRKNIIVKNLASRLDSITRYTHKDDPFPDDDIPF